jgi:hypothetical protein
MRRAFYDVGWVLADDGTLQGISLGYDHCGQHQRGIEPMLALLGVELPAYPMGVEGRTARTGPEGALVFEEFIHRPHDKRRKGYPAAMLLLKSGALARATSVRDRVKEYDLQFRGEPKDHGHRPEYDLVVSWTHDSFALCVRGAENIARARELYNAFVRCDIAVSVPWAHAFLRGGLSFVMPSRVPDEVKASVLAKDQAALELHLAAKATGIEELLQAAGKKWYAFSPSWFDAEKDEVIFCINPQDQRRYNGGWFSVEELRQWARDEGPVLKDIRLEEFLKRPEYYNWPCRLLVGMRAQGACPRHHERVTWFDEAKTIPGLRHRATRDSENVLASGTYPFEELMAKYAEPLPEKLATA